MKEVKMKTMMKEERAEAQQRHSNSLYDIIKQAITMCIEAARLA
jgi:hypothetical protein